MERKPNNLPRKRDASHQRSVSNSNREAVTLQQQNFKRVVNPYDTAETYKNPAKDRRQAYAASTRPAHRMNAIQKSKPN